MTDPFPFPSPEYAKALAAEHRKAQGCVCKRPCRNGRGCYVQDPVAEVVTPQMVVVGDLGLDSEHPVGDPDCDQCWPGYPKRCDECPRGLVHAVFGDESWDDYWLTTKCDKCGEPE